MIRRTLMQRNQELVDFEYDPETNKARVIDASEAGEELLVSTNPDKWNQDDMLGKVLRIRALSSLREDREDILAAFGAKTAIELTLREHGLSLSDRFWYRAPGSTERWEDINFFENEWDPSFGKAMLERDYDALSACSPDVPEITTGGRRLKVWERRNDGIFLIKEPRHPEDGELLGIQLASDMCYRLFGEGYHVPANIEERDGKPYSVSPIMLGPDEELVDGNRLFRIAGLRDEYDRDVAGGASPGACQNRIGVYEALGVANASAHVAKMASCACLSLFADLHGGNFGAIRKVGSKSWRAAPLYDFDGCFGQSDSDTMLPVMIAHPYIAKIFCASAFSFLDPSWDWSWYDPQSIEGFEDHILETYSPLAGSRPGFAELTASLFVMQRSYVNDTAAG